MKDYYNEEIKNVILNVIDKFYNEVSKKRSLIDPNEFKEHILKRKEQLVYVIDNFDDYMQFVNMHLVEKYNTETQIKASIPIQMAAVDIVLGKRINEVLSTLNEDINTEKVSYFNDRANRIDWMLSHIDIDTTVEEFKNKYSKEHTKTFI